MLLRLLLSFCFKQKYQTLETVFHRLSKLRHKYPVFGLIFNSLLGVWISWWNIVSCVWYIFQDVKANETRFSLSSTSLKEFIFLLFYNKTTLKWKDIFFMNRNKVTFWARSSSTRATCLAYSDIWTFRLSCSSSASFSCWWIAWEKWKIVYNST